MRQKKIPNVKDKKNKRTNRRSAIKQFARLSDLIEETAYSQPDNFLNIQSMLTDQNSPEYKTFKDYVWDKSQDSTQQDELDFLEQVFDYEKEAAGLFPSEKLSRLQTIYQQFIEGEQENKQEINIAHDIKQKMGHFTVLQAPVSTHAAHEGRNVNIRSVHNIEALLTQLKNASIVSITDNSLERFKRTAAYQTLLKEVAYRKLEPEAFGSWVNNQWSVQAIQTVINSSDGKWNGLKKQLKALERDNKRRFLDPRIQFLSDFMSEVAHDRSLTTSERIKLIQSACVLLENDEQTPANHKMKKAVKLIGESLVADVASASELDNVSRQLGRNRCPMYSKGWLARRAQLSRWLQKHGKLNSQFQKLFPANKNAQAISSDKSPSLTQAYSSGVTQKNSTASGPNSANNKKNNPRDAKSDAVLNSIKRCQ